MILQTSNNFSHLRLYNPRTGTEMSKVDPNLPAGIPESFDYNVTQGLLLWPLYLSRDIKRFYSAKINSQTLEYRNS